MVRLVAMGKSGVDCPTLTDPATTEPPPSAVSPSGLGSSVLLVCPAATAEAIAPAMKIMRPMFQRNEYPERGSIAVHCPRSPARSMR
jgi:hypothetical protein